MNWRRPTFWWTAINGSPRRPEAGESKAASSSTSRSSRMTGREEKQRGRRMRTVELLDLSDEFARLLRVGEVRRRADLAAIYGISRARVTQLLNLQGLHSDIRVFLRENARANWGNFISERSLRPLLKMTEERQLEAAAKLWPRFVATPRDDRRPTDRLANLCREVRQALI